MPWCVVAGCNNNSFKKDRAKNASFFQIPKDGSENLPKDPKICHLQFKESCFKRDLQVSFTLIRTCYAMVYYHKSRQICNLSAE